MSDMLVDKEDFLWVSFHPYAGFEYTEIEKGLFEQRAVKNEHWALHQGIFHTFPDVDEFNFKDLIIKHPRKPNLWLYMGRSNDIICLEDAQKLSPIETENMICAHPSVKGCVMVSDLGFVQHDLVWLTGSIDWERAEVCVSDGRAERRHAKRYKNHSRAEGKSWGYC